MQKRDGRLEIDEDLAFQRAEWKLQRAAGFALTAFVIAAALGVFGGGGPASRASAGAEGAPLRVEYERFVRMGATTRIVVRGTAAARDADGGLRLRVPRRYFEAIRLERATPRPAAIRPGAGAIELWFPPESVGAESFDLLLDVELLEPGKHDGGFEGGGAPAVSFVQFAYF